MKQLKLYAGRDLSNNTGENEKAIEAIGGIDVVYELANGEEYTEGLLDLACKLTDSPPVILDLKENEYITAISGSGGAYVKNLIISTNMYKKIK